MVKELHGERILWLCQFCVDASERVANAMGVPVYDGYVNANDTRDSKCVQGRGRGEGGCGGVLELASWHGPALPTR